MRAGKNRFDFSAQWNDEKGGGVVIWRSVFSPPSSFSSLVGPSGLCPSGPSHSGTIGPSLFHLRPMSFPPGYISLLWPPMVPWYFRTLILSLGFYWILYSSLWDHWFWPRPSVGPSGSPRLSCSPQGACGTLRFPSQPRGEPSGPPLASSLGPGVCRTSGFSPSPPLTPLGVLGPSLLARFPSLFPILSFTSLCLYSLIIVSLFTLFSLFTYSPV